MPDYIINCWDNKEDVFVSRRVDGKKIVSKVEGFEWYFCIKKTDATLNRDKLEKMLHNGLITKFVGDKEYVKVYCPTRRRYDTTDSVRALGITLYESDLRPYQRWLADSSSEIDLNQKVLYFDIETDDRGRGVEPGTVRLLSIACVDSDGNEFFERIATDTDVEEARVLKWFVKFVNKYDILEGWYSEGFDLVAIKRRCEIHRIPFDCDVIEESNKDLGGLHSVRKAGKFKAKMNSINHIDLMQKMKEMHYRDTELIKRVRSFSLSAISKEFLNDDKVDLEGHSIYDLWENNPEKFKEYNLHDAQLLKLLDDKIKITYQKLVEHQILHARINDYTSSRKIDAYALREAQKMGKRLFSANKTRFVKEDPEDIPESYEEVHEIDATEKDIERHNRDMALDGVHRGARKPEDSKYAGGFVYEPKTGLFDNLTVFDFQSLYPSIIKTFNISPDSLTVPNPYLGEAEVITLPTGTTFETETGIIPRIIQSVLDERNRVRHEEMPKLEKGSFEYENAHYKQYSLKVIANSMYGVMGASFSRYYRRECAEGITLTGQHLLKEMYEWLEKDGHNPIYGDTDSVFVVLKEGSDPREVGSRVNAYLDNHVKQFGVKDNQMSFDYEATYDKFLMQDKKKYVGVKGGKVAKMMGMEAKKRDTLPVTERWQKELFDKLLLEKHDSRFYKEWLVEKMRVVSSSELPITDLIFQKRLNREVESYTGAQADLVHVTIAREMKNDLKKDAEKKINLYSMGAYIPWIVTNGDDKLIGVHPDKYVSGTYDKRYYWSRAIFPALLRTLSAAVPDVEWEAYYIEKPRKNRNINPMALLEEIL